MTETVLIVDDEEPVRKTFEEWLRGAGLNIRVFSAPDAETALTIANEHPIDLAVLDWNLGSGLDGLRLLEDLVLFRPDVVAILVTGFAHQATPLDALRMGVRDYLDKSTDLTRESFVASVRKQLDRIRPAKRQRELNQSLAEFREAVEKVLPIVRTAAALNDPVPLPHAVKSLLRFSGRAVQARDGALVIRHTAADGRETTTAYGPSGQTLSADGVPFSRSLAASVASGQEAAILNELDGGLAGVVELFPFEQSRKSMLAAPLPVGGDLLRQAVAERQSHRLLFDAVEAALRASTGVQEILATSSPEEPPPQSVMERLRQGLDENANAVVDGDTTLELVEAVRSLAVRHGSTAV